MKFESCGFDDEKNILSPKYNKVAKNTKTIKKKRTVISSKMSKRLRAIEMSKNMSSLIDDIIKKENEFINSN